MKSKDRLRDVQVQTDSSGASQSDNPGLHSLIASLATERETWLKNNEPGEGATELHRQTWKELRKQILFCPRINSTWEDYAVEMLLQRGRDTLAFLKLLSKKRRTAYLAAMVDLATETTSHLTKLAVQRPRTLYPVARKRFLWPFLVASKPRFSDKHEQLVKDIGLGQDCQFSEDAIPRVRENNLAVKESMRLLCKVEAVYNSRHYTFKPCALLQWEKDALNLKPFSKQTWDKWFMVGWSALLEEWGDHPEKCDELRRIGQCRANHSLQSQTVVTPKTKESNIKDGIKENLRQAFQRLSGVPYKSRKK